MSSPLLNKKKEAISSETRIIVKDLLCPHCGGNGYTKSSPDCYRTCLDCFGKGVLSEAS